MGTRRGRPPAMDSPKQNTTSKWQDQDREEEENKGKNRRNMKKPKHNQKKQWVNHEMTWICQNRDLTWTAQNILASVAEHQQRSLWAKRWSRVVDANARKNPQGKHKCIVSVKVVEKTP